MLPLPFIAGIYAPSTVQLRNSGLFENLHGAASPDAFARKLKRLALRYHGAPLRAWLQFLTKDQTGAKGALKKLRADFSKKHMPAGGCGEVSRAAQRFSLIGAAGELATAAGITGWSAGESTDGAARCFKSWLDNRGTTGGADLDAAIRQIRRFLEANGASRFQTLVKPGVEPPNERVVNRAGFRRRRDDETEYLVLPESFKKEVCAGFDYRAVLKELDARGFLVRTPPDFTIKPRLPELGTVRVYCVRAAILEGDD